MHSKVLSIKKIKNKDPKECFYSPKYSYVKHFKVETLNYQSDSGSYVVFNKIVELSKPKVVIVNQKFIDEGEKVMFSFSEDFKRASWVRRCIDDINDELFESRLELKNPPSQKDEAKVVDFYQRVPICLVEWTVNGKKRINRVIEDRGSTIVVEFFGKHFIIDISDILTYRFQTLLFIPNITEFSTRKN